MVAGSVLALPLPRLLYAPHYQLHHSPHSETFRISLNKEKLDDGLHEDKIIITY